MRSALSVVAAIFAIFAALPYIIDIIRGKTRPNIVTWITWTLLTGIAAAAALESHELRTALLLLATSVSTLTVVLLGIKYGIAKFTLFDGMCQAGAIVGLILWRVYNSPDLAIIATVAIDLIGILPTLKHAYEKPGEETWQSYSLAAIPPTLTIVSLSSYSIASLLFPGYLVFADGLLGLLIILRRNKLGISLSRRVGA